MAASSDKVGNVDRPSEVVEADLHDVGAVGVVFEKGPRLVDAFDSERDSHHATTVCKGTADRHETHISVGWASGPNRGRMFGLTGSTGWPPERTAATFRAAR